MWKAISSEAAASSLRSANVLPVSLRRVAFPRRAELLTIAQHCRGPAPAGHAMCLCMGREKPCHRQRFSAKANFSLPQMQTPTYSGGWILRFS
ncbi:solute carrier family 22 member 5 [Anopheles sinensis]|uniref:Solute carrier family 22 member 5 n=1 Tax=Anopheles sinensis TaxID=74873 RepID=A0A084VEI9_ANOSI|nr:solute carrier family 22 member 5 [Anopheles sinensis]